MQNLFKFSSLLTLHVMIYHISSNNSWGRLSLFLHKKGTIYLQNDLNSLPGFTILCKVVEEIIFSP